MGLSQKDPIPADATKRTRIYYAIFFFNNNQSLTPRLDFRPFLRLVSLYLSSSSSRSLSLLLVLSFFLSLFLVGMIVECRMFEVM